MTKFKVIPLILFLSATLIVPVKATTVKRTEACLSCHGQQLEGDPEIGTPGLAGQQSDYLRRQLTKFAEAQRGIKEEDTSGALMKSMHLLFGNDTSIDEYVEFIASFPASKPAPYTKGNAQKGRDIYYYTCSVCHGKDGAGSEEYSAPNLLVIGGEYFFSQFKKFQSATRGSLDDDIHAKRMWAMSQVIETDEELENVISYVESLRETGER